MMTADSHTHPAAKYPVARKVVDFLVWTALATLSIFFLTGCETLSAKDLLSRGAKPYQPSNVFQADSKLPAGVRRVAVLPMTSGRQLPQSEADLDQLTSTLSAELGKTKKLELVAVSPVQMRQWTGKEGWNADDKLPPNFLETVREATGCDAILFNRLTAYRPYPPMQVGWNLRLLDAKTGQSVWAIDEVYDAAQEAVANGARQYQQSQHLGNPALADSRSVLYSPLRFSQYTAAISLATMPER